MGAGTGTGAGAGAGAGSGEAARAATGVIGVAETKGRAAAKMAAMKVVETISNGYTKKRLWECKECNGKRRKSLT